MKAEYSRQIFEKYSYIQHKSHIKRPGIEPRYPRWQAGKYPLDLWHDPVQ